MTDAPELTDDQIRAAAADLLRALYAECGADCGEEMPELESPDGGEAVEGGDVRKAFDESKHPRDDHGQFIDKGELHAAKSDPAKADELRKRVTDPGEREKLEKHLGGEQAAKENPPTTVDTPTGVGDNASTLPEVGSEEGGGTMGFTRPPAKERKNDKGDAFAPHDDPASVKGGFVAKRDRVHEATLAADGSAKAEAEPTQTYLRHGMIAVKDGVPRVYAAVTKNGKPDVLFVQSEGAADFRDAVNTLRAAGLDPVEHLPHAAAHTIGTGTRSMRSRVHEYLKDAGVEPPAPAKPTPTDREALKVAASAGDDTAKLAHADATLEDPRATPKERHEAFKAGVWQPAIDRRDAASRKLESLKRRAAGVWDNDSGQYNVEPEAIDPEEMAAATAELEAAQAALKPIQDEKARLFQEWVASAGKKVDSGAAKPAAVTIRGNTYAVRDQLAKIPGAKYDQRRKAWTVPAEHADRAKQIVAAAPKTDTQAELLKLSDAELAERGLVRTSGPRGPYVRRGTPEELNDHL